MPKYDWGFEARIGNVTNEPLAAFRHVRHAVLPQNSPLRYFVKHTGRTANDLPLYNLMQHTGRTDTVGLEIETVSGEHYMCGNFSARLSRTSVWSPYGLPYPTDRDMMAVQARRGLGECDAFASHMLQTPVDPLSIPPYVLESLSKLQFVGTPRATDNIIEQLWKHPADPVNLQYNAIVNARMEELLNDQQ